MNVTARIDSRLFQQLAFGRPGPVRSTGRALYRAAIRGELAATAARDRIARSGGEARRPRSGDEVTAVVKTFERPHLLRRLLASLDRIEPEMPVVVVDDSRDPVDPRGVELVRLPYDSGVSAGRSAGLERVRTEYVLMLDDDFVFYRRSALDETLAVLDEHPRIDLVGGLVVDLPLGSRIDYRTTPLFPTETPAVVAPGTRIGGLPVYDKVANFFVGRTERIRQVGWDPELRRVEHRDFFTRARGVLTSVFNSEFRCLHAKGYFDADYLSRRYDLAASQALLADRWPSRE
jgi:glycosyltransferase involved in cell wall biosynthesis